MRRYLGFFKYIFSAEAVKLFLEFYGYSELIAISGSRNCGFFVKEVDAIFFKCFSLRYDFELWRDAKDLKKSKQEDSF